MNTIIIEANSTWRERLQFHIKQHPLLKFRGTFESVLEAYHVIHTENIDLIFVDLNRVGLETMDFSRGLNKTPLIIFSKSNQSFLFNSENSVVVDILSGSLNTQRFQKAIDKAQKWFQQDEKDNHFFIRTKNSYVKLSYDEVYYIKALENFVQIVTRKETFTKLVSLKKILEQLPSEKFVQVHRSFIVNAQAVLSIEKDCIRLEMAEIPIGNSYKEALLKVIVKQTLILR